MKITSTIFLITTIITSNLFGQDSEKNTSSTEYKKLRIGINFSPDICFRTLKNNDRNSTSADILNSRNANEVSKPGFTTGLNVVYNLNENFGIEAGIQYSNKGYQTKMQDLTFGSLIEARRGFVYNPSTPAPVRGQLIYNLNYLDIPLKVNFLFGKGKIRLITSAGVTTNIFLYGTTTSVLEYNDGNQEKNNQPTSLDYYKINVSPLVSVGIDWKLNSRNNLRIEPTFRYGLLKIIDAPVTAYLWNTGLNIGYYFGLK